MCKKSNFKRFLKIYEYIKKDDNYIYHRENNSIKIYYKLFNTELGPRNIVAFYGKGLYNSKLKSGIFLEYRDSNDTCLFLLRIEKHGKIYIMETKVDQPAIFSAIYEIENIINDKKQKYKDNILEKLFENIDEFSFKDRIFG